jgi:hypothetical protein
MPCHDVAVSQNGFNQLSSGTPHSGCRVRSRSELPGLVLSLSSSVRRPRHLKRAESGSARSGGAGANRQPTSHIVNAVFGDCHVSYYCQFLTNY